MFFYIVLVIIAAAAIWGFVQGFIHQVGSVAGLLAAVIVCRVFGTRVAEFACADIAPGSDATFITILAFLALGLVTYLCVWLLARMAKGLVRGLRLGILDKIAGAVYKAFLWMIVVSLIYNVYVCVAPQSAPQDSNPDDVWKMRVLRFSPSVFGSESARKVIEQVQSAITE